MRSWCNFPEFIGNLMDSVRLPTRRCAKCSPVKAVGFSGSDQTESQRNETSLGCKQPRNQGKRMWDKLLKRLRGLFLAVKEFLTGISISLIQRRWLRWVVAIDSCANRRI